MIVERKIKVFFLVALVLLISFFLLLGGASFSRQQFSYIYNPAVHAAAPVTKGLELPMPKPSSISVERDNVRLDLERVTVHQYYIVYSVIYGDQSHTAYHLFLTDLQKRPLDLKGVGQIWLETETGEKIEQIADPVVKDYPEDQPMKWKIEIEAKFPHQSSMGDHKLFVRYHDKVLTLTGIRY